MTERTADDRSISIIIANPAAAADDALALAVQQQRDRGHRLELIPTRAAGDGGRLCREWLARGATRLIAAGGDGLLNEIASALLDSTAPLDDAAPTVPLGVLPYGTANDFARANGLAPGDVATSLSVALENRPRLVDVVRCNDAYFINSCTAGFGAKITTDTQSGIKNLLGGASYLLNALARISELEPYQLEIEGDAIHWRGEALGLAITNGRQAGGGVVISPDALIDDGVVDGLLFPAMTLSSAAYLFQQFSTGERPAEGGDIVLLHGNRLRIRADRPLPITLDGEPAEGSEFLLTVCPGALSMALPADSPLVGSGRQPETGPAS